ncbi:MAG TPA: carboxypeptidase-like regulatory domain-containing protein [Cyclobacteriaceae bacterium]
MKKLIRKKIGLTLLAFVITVTCFAQDVVTVKGIVIDSAKLRPIPFVNVVVKKANRGTATDQKGNFIINARSTDTIRFSFVGYKTLELPAKDWEPSVIMMAEVVTVLKTLTVHGEAVNPYEGMFDEEIRKLEDSKKSPPFYFSKNKKEKILVARAKNEQVRVKHYVDLLVKDESVKKYLMKQHRLTETRYYDLLARFNQKNYAIMYYLTDSELLTLLYRFYDVNADQ